MRQDFTAILSNLTKQTTQRGASCIMGWFDNFRENGGIRGAIDGFRTIVLDSNDVTPSSDIQTAVKRIKMEQRAKVEDAVERANYEAGQKLREFNQKRDNLQETVRNALDANSPVVHVFRTATQDMDLQPADHLFVQRTGYTHHGLYLGNGRVVHYLLEQGIVEDSVATFADGAEVYRRDSPLSYSRGEAVRRARRRIGESAYNLFHNNCENFVTWCRSGPEY